MALETISDVEILNFIAHGIDHNAPQPDLSDLETPLTGGFPHAFFEKYILLALEDENRRRACFRGPGGTVITEFRSLQAGKTNFVDASREIARRLHTTMSGSKNLSWIKAGDLMVALFRDRKAKGGRSYLALLKVDLSDAVIRRVEMIGTQRQVVFEQSQGRVPQPGEGKLHKVALVSDQREKKPEPFDLVILDYDIRKEQVARFFYDQFLESDLNRNATEVTRVMLGELKHAVSQGPDTVKPPLRAVERVEIIDRAEQFAQQSAETSTAELVQKAIVNVQPAERRLNVRDHLIASLTRRVKIEPAETVALDSQEAQKAARRLTYVLDYQVKIIGEEADVKRIVEIDPEPDDAGRTVLRIATQRFDIE